MLVFALASSALAAADSTSPKTDYRALVSREHLVYGAPEWVRLPRLPITGEERVRVSAVINDAIAQLKKGAANAAAA